uniref:MYND-type domain-containing protein n=1 Tax=Clytia hemisphaerica TaxID=252671 RepID=A0A7M5X5P7_9CNID
MENPKKCMKCSNHGTKKCGQCLQVYYYNRDCQIAHWKIHKPSCKPCNKAKRASTEKRKESKNMKRAKTIYVKAGSFDSYDEFDTKTELFELESYGNEAGEMKEIRSRFGWKDVSGTLYKFYSPNESDFQWYYYIYYDDTRNRAKNFLMKMCSHLGAVLQKSMVTSSFFVADPCRVSIHTMNQFLLKTCTIVLNFIRLTTQ